MVSPAPFHRENVLGAARHRLPVLCEKPLALNTTQAEALIATAMGLFAAIPAVIAYNRYADKVVRLEYRYDGFMEEFSSILHRHASAKLGV